MAKIDQTGDWMQTYTGRVFYPWSPCPGDVELADIAHHLSMVCRFAGASRKFYSVAQHSVLVSGIVEPKWEFAALFHDAAEAYIGDLVRAVKTGLEDRHDHYDALEKLIMRAVDDRFGIARPWEAKHAIRVADDIALMTERRDLLAPPPQPWHPGLEKVTPLDDVIEPLDPPEAEDAFFARYYELVGRFGYYANTPF